jgi:predicted RNase H-like HicB family nuclease
MMSDLQAMAQECASRPYLTVVLRDETTDGDPIYVAMNPELEGCIAQGDTPDEARQNLSETRIDFIRYMLEDDVPIPEPQPISNAVIYANVDFEGAPLIECGMANFLLKT